jgi:hypothetical protein
MNLEEYTYYRTGTTKLPVLVRNMFVKPFVSSSLKDFWKYWNPTWGYYLLFYGYKPLRTIFPAWLALIMTFFISGLFHDIIYILPMLMQELQFVFPFITVWFVVIAIGILVTEYLRIDFKNLNWRLRPVFHFGYLISTFILTRYIDLAIG